MKVQFVILITLASVVALGCYDDAPKKPGPLARASVEKPTLTSSAPTKSAPTKAPKAEPKPDAETALDDTEAPKAKAVQDTSRATAHEAPEVEFVESQAMHDPEPFLDTDDGVTLNRLLTAPSVEAREPVAASSLFGHHEEKIYAFMDVENSSAEDKVLTVFFIAPSGKATGGVELSIPADTPRWRTWAFTRHADEVGLWRVEVRSPSGALLGALPFEVAEGC